MQPHDDNAKPAGDGETAKGGEKPSLRRPLAIAFYFAGSPLTTILISYLSRDGNFGQSLSGNFAMNFYRLTTGAATLVLIAWLACREDFKRALRNRRQLARIAIFAFIMSVYQAMFVQGIAQTSGVLAQLLLILSPAMAILLAVIVHRDERKEARGRWFILGLALAGLGAAGVAMGRGGMTLTYSIGAMYLLFASVFWGWSALVKKKLVADIHPATASAIFTAFMCLYFFIASLLWGGLGRVAEISMTAKVVLFASGAYGFLSGIGFFRFLAIRMLGILKTSFIELTWPIFAGIYGYLILGEVLTVWQLLFGAVLMAGCYLVLAGRRGRAPTGCDAS